MGDKHWEDRDYYSDLKSNNIVIPVPVISESLLDVI